MEDKRVIDVRRAVQSARDYIQDIQDLLESPLENLRLEEIELSEDEQYWLVTLGYDIEKQNNLPMLLASKPQELSREYKLFQINSDSGKVEAMKIRKV